MSFYIEVFICFAFFYGSYRAGLFLSKKEVAKKEKIDFVNYDLKIVEFKNLKEDIEVVSWEEKPEELDQRSLSSPNCHKMIL